MTTTMLAMMFGVDGGGGDVRGYDGSSWMIILNRWRTKWKRRRRVRVRVRSGRIRRRRSRRAVPRDHCQCLQLLFSVSETSPLSPTPEIHKL